MNRRTLLQAAVLAPVAATLPQVAEAKYPVETLSRRKVNEVLWESFLYRPGVQDYIRGMTERLSERLRPLEGVTGVYRDYWLYGEAFFLGPQTYHPSDVAVLHSPALFLVVGETQSIQGMQHVANRASLSDLRGTSILMPWFRQLYLDPSFDLPSFDGPIKKVDLDAKIEIAASQFLKAFRSEGQVSSLRIAYGGRP